MKLFWALLGLIIFAGMVGFMALWLFGIPYLAYWVFNGDYYFYTTVWLCILMVADSFRLQRAKQTIRKYEEVLGVKKK
jgi:hypothetical protein